MKKVILGLGLGAIAFSIALLGCQTTEQGTVSSILTEQTGLAPNGDKQHATRDFSPFIASVDTIKSWKVEMVTGNGVQKQWSGNADNVPSMVTWDGRNDMGSLAPEGTYSAKLIVDYGMGSPSTVQSNSFILDISPPTGSVSFNPGQFTTDKNGTVQSVTVSIQGSSAVARMDSWSLDILDQDGRAFRSFDGDWSNSEIVWDGKSSSGDWVLPAQPRSPRSPCGRVRQLLARLLGDCRERPPPAGPAGGGSGNLCRHPGAGGFSPTSDSFVKTMKLSLSYGPRQAVRSWKLDDHGLCPAGAEDRQWRWLEPSAGLSVGRHKQRGKPHAGGARTRPSFRSTTAARSSRGPRRARPSCSTSPPPPVSSRSRKPLFSPIEGFTDDNAQGRCKLAPGEDRQLEDECL